MEDKDMVSNNQYNDVNTMYKCKYMCTIQTNMLILGLCVLTYYINMIYYTTNMKMKHFCKTTIFNTFQLNVSRCINYFVSFPVNSF